MRMGGPPVPSSGVSDSELSFEAPCRGAHGQGQRLYLVWCRLYTAPSEENLVTNFNPENSLSNLFCVSSVWDTIHYWWAERILLGSCFILSDYSSSLQYLLMQHKCWFFLLSVMRGIIWNLEFSSLFNLYILTSSFFFANSGRGKIIASDYDQLNCCLRNFCVHYWGRACVHFICSQEFVQLNLFHCAALPELSWSGDFHTGSSCSSWPLAKSVTVYNGGQSNVPPQHSPPL